MEGRRGGRHGKNRDKGELRDVGRKPPLTGAKERPSWRRLLPEETLKTDHGKKRGQGRGKNSKMEMMKDTARGARGVFKPRLTVEPAKTTQPVRAAHSFQSA